MNGANDAFGDLAGELGTEYLDILTPLLADAEYMAALTRADRMHCDSRGYAAMAERVDAWGPWDAWFS